MRLTDGDADIILETAGEDITVKLAGIVVETIKGVHRLEVVTAGSFQAEAALPVPFLTIKGDKAALYVGQGNYTFGYQGTDYRPYGKYEQRAGGSLARVRLTK